MTNWCSSRVDLEAHSAELREPKETSPCASSWKLTTPSVEVKPSDCTGTHTHTHAGPQAQAVPSKTSAWPRQDPWLLKQHAALLS